MSLRAPNRLVPLAAYALALLSALASPVHAQTGTVIGRVLDGKEGAAFANIVVLGTKKGAMADVDGVFRIPLVPVGSHTLRVELMSHEPRMVTIDVNAGENRIAPIVLGAEKIAATIPEFKVVDTRIDLHSTTTKHEVSRQHMNDLHFDTVMDAIATRAGVVAQAGQIHIRGGRGDELGVLFDEMPVLDPITRQAPSIAILAVEETDLFTGGITAEYGGSLSGVVNITTREGGEKFGGDVQWHTDRYGETGKTFNNYDRVTVGVGGPTPIRGLTYFATYEGMFSDTYLHSGLQRAAAATSSTSSRSGTGNRTRSTRT